MSVLYGAMPDASVTPGVESRQVQQIIGAEEIRAAAETLQKYKNGKKNLENRVVEDELWYQLRHWDALRHGRSKDPSKLSPEPTSAWMFNVIMNKHADAMDNYPEAVVLPRERSDEQSAKLLSSVMPVILEYNEFEKTYDAAWWEKLKHGTSVFGVFWNTEKENGLGDIDIQGIDLLKIFWEPGVTDIQKSANLYIVDLADNVSLEAQYPQLKGKLGGGTIDVTQYVYDDTVDVSDKSVVVDWYYKLRAPDGRKILHYAKFVGDTLLYASENDPAYQQRGYYDHGMYPVVFDVLYPEKGTPCGFGEIAVCKDPQIYVDKISANVMENSMMMTKRRYFVSSATNVNEDEFLDWTRPIIHVEGELDDRRIKEVECRPLDSVYLSVMQSRIEELKETSGNRDVNSGSATGVTAAAAIAALQEAGNKSSRDMISGSYRAHTVICRMCIELIRQFYDEARSFRIAGDGAAVQFVELSNAGLRDQPVGVGSLGEQMYRRPIFDLKIKAQKRNPFSRMEQNERAKELYGLGFFNPERAQESMIALDMMDFEGIDKVREKVQQGQTLYAVVQQMAAQQQQMAAIIAQLTGQQLPDAQVQQSSGGKQVQQSSGGGLDEAASSAQTPMTSYGQRLAKRSKPSVDGQ